MGSVKVPTKASAPLPPAAIAAVGERIVPPTIAAAAVAVTPVSAARRLTTVAAADFLFPLLGERESALARATSTNTVTNMVVNFIVMVLLLAIKISGNSSFLDSSLLCC